MMMIGNDDGSLMVLIISNDKINDKDNNTLSN